MSAHESLSTALFHGSAHEFKPGETVEPRTSTTAVFNGKTAYSTTSHSTATAYARLSAERGGMLFGHVYEVEPLGQTTPPKERIGTQDQAQVVTSREGFRVKKHEGWA